MFYRIKENKIYDCADYKYTNDCLENDISYQEYLKNSDKYAVINGTIQGISQTPEYIAEELAKAKADKLQENTTKRDARLIAGVTYKNILFDSDQDQKINLSAIASNMSDTDTITWFGKDGVSSLNCTKTDIENIGKLIISLTQDVWSNLNPTYIDKINACKTIEELNEIEIDYAV
jgi:hypothetical protein